MDVQGCGVVGNEGDGGHAVFTECGDHEGGVEAACVVVQDFPTSCVINAGPGGAGPDIVKLPVEGSHGLWPCGTQVLGGNGNAFGLHQLAQVDEAFEIFGFAECTTDVQQKALVAVAVVKFLVGTHHLGCEGEVFWAGECADGAYIRKGLQAIFGHEARGDIEVFGDWECGVAPDFPVVHVAVVGLVCWAVEVGAGGGGPVWGARGVEVDGFAQDAAEQGGYAALYFAAFFRGQGLFEGDAVAPMFPAGLYFVVAAPQDNAGVVAESGELFDGFLADVFAEVHVVGGDGSAEHEILPNHDAQCVGQGVEVFVLIVASAPDAEHVHIGCVGVLEGAADGRFGHAAGDAVEWDEVGAFGEDRNAVDHEGHAFSPLVRFATQGDGA